jgi:predicted Zn-dependent protease
VTGENEIVLMSPEREAAMGREASLEVERDIGLVAAPGLAAYVGSLGERLGALSPRQDVSYSVQVVNMPETNAFALPGGYTYVSRGLLALANTEGQLVNVIAHEVGHVAARHAAGRETRAVGVGLLSMLGTIAAGVLGGAEAAQTVAQIGQVAGAGLIATYSRDQERQADRVGQELAARAGWDPAAMAEFLRSLERETALQHEGGRMPKHWRGPSCGPRPHRLRRHEASSYLISRGCSSDPTRRRESFAITSFFTPTSISRFVSRPAGQCRTRARP